MAQTSPLVIAPGYAPNFAGIGVGATPDYFGSSDYKAGAAPGVHLSWGRRYVDLVGNYLSANVLDHPHWRAGPALVYRFGRDDVIDEVVNGLPEIDDTTELGVFLARVYRPSEDVRDRLRIGGNITYDVGGVHDGYTVGLSVNRWLPVFRYSAVGLSVATTYGSGNYMDTYFSVTPQGSATTGLPAYQAGAGLRDVRLSAVFIQPLSEKFFVGAGVLYDRILGDAQDSPIVSMRGARDQVLFGVGAGILF
ncbi:MipA/OmpV family protein [Chachezhania sediminis]|uniref:MipA/OmpV family protein n=1 Tax=Chachezhania sediminis TaxID=2599291 RepID=UPI00131CFAA2|nr:MipA/OmpV family protein [Chachezhania sediminis]